MPAAVGRPPLPALSREVAFGTSTGAIVSRVKSAGRHFRWLFLAAAVGVPGFFQYDTTAAVHEGGVFTPYTIARITFYLLLFVCVMLLLLLRGQWQSLSKPRWNLPLLLAFLVFSLASFRQPLNGILQSHYFLMEWFLLIVLVWGVLSSYPREQWVQTTIHLVAVVCWAVMIIVALGAVLVPDLALMPSGLLPRLGGYLYHPNQLGVIAGIALLHAIYCAPAARRLVLIPLPAVMLLGSYSRGAILGVVAAIVLSFLASGKRRALRAAVAFLLLCGVVVFSQQAVAFLDRDGNTESLRSGNSRTLIWEASWRLFQEDPYRGHGFVSGSKRLGEYMEYRWFAPQHAHQEFFQAGLSAGVLGALLLLVVYIQAFRHVRLFPVSERERVFLFVAVAQIVFYALQTPVFSGRLQPLGAIAFILFALLVQQFRAPEKAVRTAL